MRELGTPAVIAMSDLVSLSTAQALASGFYTWLAQQDGAPLYVLVTLRAEFLADAAPYVELRQLLQAHQIKRWEILWSNRLPP